MSQPGGQPPYDVGYLRELVTSAIKLYEIHPMAGHPVTEDTGAAMLTHTALLQQLADGIDARYDCDNPDALKNAWINVVSQILGALHGALEMAAECRGTSITETWQAIAASLALDGSADNAQGLLDQRMLERLHDADAVTAHLEALIPYDFEY